MQRHLDVAHDGAWLDRLTRDIVRSADRDHGMKFQLNPERLGALQVEIGRSGDTATVRFTAETEAARALIADARPALIAEAKAQGMTIADARVDLSAQPTQAGSGQNGAGQNGAGQNGAGQNGFGQGGFGQGSFGQGGGAGAFAQQQQSGGQRPSFFERPAAAAPRSAAAGIADRSAARAERYA